jgi:hypothetical protein
MDQPIWEYKTLPVEIQEGLLDDMQLDQNLAALGAEGWEVYSVSPIVAEGSTRYLVHHLRRIGEPPRRAGFTTE